MIVRLSKTASRLARHVIVVVSFVVRFIDQYEAGLLQETPIDFRPQRLRWQPRHGVFPLADLAWRGEEEAAVRHENVRDLPNELRLSLGLEQEDQAPGDHTIEFAPEKVRLLDATTLDRYPRKTRTEGGDHAWRGIDAVDREAGVNQNARHRIARAATEIQHRAAGSHRLGPCANRAHTDGNVARFDITAAGEKLGRDRIISVRPIAHDERLRRSHPELSSVGTNLLQPL